MSNGVIYRSINWKRLASTAPLVAVIHMFLLYGLFMNPISLNVIFSENLGQSDKLIAVWNTLEPIPSEISLMPALIITPMIFSFLFAVLYESIPGSGRLRKGFFFGIMWWGTVAVFFELFTPLGLFGEPLHLLGYELFLWFVGLAAVGIILGILYVPKSIST